MLICLTSLCSILFYVWRTCMEESESDYHFKIEKKSSWKNFHLTSKSWSKLYNFKWFCKRLKLHKCCDKVKTKQEKKRKKMNDSVTALKNNHLIYPSSSSMYNLSIRESEACHLKRRFSHHKLVLLFVIGPSYLS